MRLSYEVLRSSGISDLDGPNLFGGGTGTGGATREQVSETGGVVVLGVSGPWGRPHGPMIFLAVRWVIDP
jgi:hypothetical protein